MIDLPRTGPCRHHECRRRAVRAGVCIDHWQDLNGTEYGPWPEDVEPQSWRDRYLKRTGTPYLTTRERGRARIRRISAA